MKEINNFNELEISENIKRSISDMGITEPTPIQKKAILPALTGYDVLAQAPTGTGKTFAFGIPLIEKIDKFSDEIQGLVVCPTRELAIQVCEELKSLSKYEEKIRILALYGGENIERQITFLRDKPQLIVATPGRLNDHLKRKKVTLDNVKCVVLDEADEMLSMGFLPDMDMILGKAPFDSQKLLFSATLPQEILNIAKKYQKGNSVKIKIQSEKKALSPQISQFYLEMKHSLKTDMLRAIIDINKYKLCLVFCNTKKKADELCEELVGFGCNASVLHGDMKQFERDRVMYKFRNDRIDILVATDVAARGVDVEGIEAVFNYDIPRMPEHYVHRIGRTGRADKSGTAYTFLSNSEMFLLKEIMKYTKTEIKPMKRPSFEEVLRIRALEALNKAEKIANTEDLHWYMSIIEENLEFEGKLKELTAALLYMNLNPVKNDEKSPEKNAKKSEKNEKNKKKTEKNDKISRLFFNVGSLDKIKRRHLEELINSHPMLCGMRIYDVDIFDKFSFINVKESDANDICDALTGMKFKGRELYVEIAEGEKKIKKNRKTSKKSM